jgi:hypothetical protein
LASAGAPGGAGLFGERAFPGFVGGVALLAPESLFVLGIVELAQLPGKVEEAWTGFAADPDGDGAA